MKIFTQIILIFFIFWIVDTTFAEDNKDPAFKLYENRVETLICWEYKPKAETEALLTKEIKYLNPYKKWETATWVSDLSNDNFIDKAKTTYKETMNNMYKCALLKIQIKELWNIKKLINVDKTWELGKSISQKIDGKITKLKTIANNWWQAWSWSCIVTKEDKEFSKKEVLQNVTYETCKYVSYLDFLRSYYTNTQNLTYQQASENIKNDEILFPTINWLTKEFNSLQTDIDNEEKHVVTTFPIAFQSYNEYSYNYPLHVLLELIKEDLMIFRDKLHAAINPINQVVYKISNAMSKE